MPDCEEESEERAEGVGAMVTRHYNRQGIVSSFKPKTPLGRQLWYIRKRIVASGETILGWDEIEKEVAVRRGEAD
jgi:hypothetical protein